MPDPNGVQGRMWFQCASSMGHAPYHWSGASLGYNQIFTVNIWLALGCSLHGAAHGGGFHGPRTPSLARCRLWSTGKYLP